MKFLYCGGNTMDNLGNGFLDIGAWYQMKQIAPDADIISISNTFPSKQYYYGNPTGLRWPGAGDRNRFDLRTIFDADYVVFTAACLCDNWFAFNEKLIKHLIATQMKVVILGASGSDSGTMKYSQDEFGRVRDLVKKMNLHVMTSRDQSTYDGFSDLATHAHNGVDCAMYLNDAFSPAIMNMNSFDVFTFDSIREPKITTSREVLRLCHKVSVIDSFCRMIRHPIQVLSLANTRDWASEWPDDYLHMYANCHTVYTDRVHACVAALIFGKRAMYMGKSPRAGLLTRVLQGADITKKPVSLDLDYVEREKDAQLDFLKTHLGD